MSLTHFFDAYIACALWASTDAEGQPLDATYSKDDLSPATLTHMQEECEAFFRSNWADCWEHGSAAQCGMDFWLTRNRHGTGFWARGTGDVGQRLTRAAHAYGTVDLSVGNDGHIYQG